MRVSLKQLYLYKKSSLFSLTYFFPADCKECHVVDCFDAKKPDFYANGVFLTFYNQPTHKRTKSATADFINSLD